MDEYEDQASQRGNATRAFGITAMHDPAAIFKLFEFGLISGVTLSVLLWQLWSIRREIRKDKAKSREEA